MPTRSANPAPSGPVSDSLATNEASTHRHQANEGLLGRVTGAGRDEWRQMIVEARNGAD